MEVAMRSFCRLNGKTSRRVSTLRYKDFVWFNTALWVSLSFTSHESPDSRLHFDTIHMCLFNAEEPSIEYSNAEPLSMIPGVGCSPTSSARAFLQNGISHVTHPVFPPYLESRDEAYFHFGARQ